MAAFGEVKVLLQNRIAARDAAAATEVRMSCFVSSVRLLHDECIECSLCSLSMSLYPSFSFLSLVN